MATVTHYEVAPLERLINEVRKFRPYSLQTFYRHSRRFKIKPAGIRSRPAIYRVEDFNRLLGLLGFTGKIQIAPEAHLGLAGAPGPATASPLPAKVRRSRSLLSVPELKATRPVPATALRKPALAPRGKVSR